MASRYRYSFKFRYDSDLGQTVIKRQRVYVDENDNEVTPITPLFRARVVETPEKVTGTSKGLRRLLTYIGDRQSTANIPYRDEATLIAHIREILAVERVICGDYFGETQVTGGATNSFSG